MLKPVNGLLFDRLRTIPPLVGFVDFEAEVEQIFSGGVKRTHKVRTLGGCAYGTLGATFEQVFLTNNVPSDGSAIQDAYNLNAMPSWRVEYTVKGDDVDIRQVMWMSAFIGRRVWYSTGEVYEMRLHMIPDGSSVATAVFNLDELGRLTGVQYGFVPWKNAKCEVRSLEWITPP